MILAFILMNIESQDQIILHCTIFYEKVYQIMSISPHQIMLINHINKYLNKQITYMSNILRNQVIQIMNKIAHQIRYSIKKQKDLHQKQKLTKINLQFFNKMSCLISQIIQINTLIMKLVILHNKKESEPLQIYLIMVQMLLIIVLQYITNNKYIKNNRKNSIQQPASLNNTIKSLSNIQNQHCKIKIYIFIKNCRHSKKQIRFITKN